MDAIIESLNARKARNAAMLNLGQSSGSGSSLFLKSSSLQPQTVFRQMKTSLSVNRPSVPVMRASSMATFSQNTGSKYSNSMSLLHLRPGNTQNTSTVQRAPASMPLPTAGGVTGAQSISETPASFSSAPAPSETPAFPPKSERRPVVFDRSDGPSDFEKRLMANKKQQQAQEAKQRGPDRRKVRTERIEISSNDSKEVNRDFAPFDSVTPAASSQSSAPTIQREMLEPSEIRRAAQKKASENISHTTESVSDANETVQREMNTAAAQAVISEKSSLPKATVQRESIHNESPVSSRAESLPHAEMISGDEKTVQREFTLPAVNAAGEERVESVANETEAVSSQPSVIQRESLTSAKSTGNTQKQSTKSAKSAASRNSSQTVQRESAPAAEAEADDTPKSAEPINEVNKTVRREMADTGDNGNTETSHPEKITGKKDVSAETVQREPLKKAAPLGNETEQPSESEISEAVEAETIQREILPIDSSVEHSESSAKTAVDHVSRETIQRQSLPSTTEPNQRSEKNAQDVRFGNHSEGTVQRETIASAEPISDQTEQSAEPAMPVPAAKETVQREPIASAEPISDQTEKTAEPAMPVPAVKETVQREPIASAEPISDQTDKASDTAMPVPAVKETVQREPIASAEPISDQTDKASDTAMPVPAVKETVQREPIASAEPISDQTEKTAESAMPVPAAKETVQREPIASAEPIFDQTDKALDTAMPVPAVKETVQRESIASAEPISEQTENNIESAKPVSGTRETVQREGLKSAAPLDTHADIPQMPVVQRESAESDNIVQRASDLPDDIKDMLQGFPTHYEMPQEQIDAIRSGQTYTPQSNAVQREFEPAQQENKNEKSISAAAPHNIVQRELYCRNRRIKVRIHNIPHHRHQLCSGKWTLPQVISICRSLV